mmetsp:Transcript_9149/g.8902  ORF Transcript_9149/g.8902 Transcript_9149/m.8902 type:complete len:86 (-) Transcript_9149:102-359(-)
MCTNNNSNYSYRGWTIILLCDRPEIDFLLDLPEEDTLEEEELSLLNLLRKAPFRNEGVSRTEPTTFIFMDASSFDSSCEMTLSFS